MKKILTISILFLATNSFAQKADTIPPPPPMIETIKGEDKENDRIFQKVETEAEFVGGLIAWRKFLEKNLKADTPAKNGAIKGRYAVIVRFIVEKDGSLGDFKIMQNGGFGTGEEVVRLLKKSPKWKPGIQNGVVVKSYKMQPVTFIVDSY
jgi:periplasmic protein TonB